LNQPNVLDGGKAVHFVRSASSSVAKHRRGLGNLVRAPQLVTSLRSALILLALLTGRQIRPQSLVGLNLSHVLAKHRPGFKLI
jgi:hypothetical protein